MTWLDILSKFGIPGLTVAALIASVKILYSQNRAIRLGLQAVLCSTLVSKYTFYLDKGYVPIHERKDFENVYQHYHTLGANGVIDDLRNKFLALPVMPPNDEPNTAETGGETD